MSGSSGLSVASYSLVKRHILAYYIKVAQKLLFGEESSRETQNNSRIDFRNANP